MEANQQDASHGEARDPKADYGRLPTEREVLRALWGARKELVRSEIRRRMPHEHRPTLGRVGQILSALHKDQLLVRVQGRAQGSRKAGFYALSDNGRALCRDLGFEREEQLLFYAPAEMLRTNLTRERLSWRPTSPGRVITAYSYRGGLGLTTLVAHVARGLAEDLPADQRVLVMDLDLGTPGLDEFFAREGLGPCRGLGGLIVDYQRQSPRTRDLWLRGALRDPKYVLQPWPQEPNFVYLPSGIGSSKAGLRPSERAEAMKLLHEETAAARAVQGHADPENRGFLAVLRDALLQNFARIVIDSQFGNALGSWIATLSLADELLLCMDYEDTSEATTAGIRAALANFLSRYNPENARGGGVLFLFRLKGPKAATDFDAWIEDHLVLDSTVARSAATYRREQLPYNVRLVLDRHRKEYTRFYRHIIAEFYLTSTKSPRAPSPEEKALLTVLDSKASPIARSLSGGLLEKTSLQELVRVVEWYHEEGLLPSETDEEGYQLIWSVIESHTHRLLRNILRRTGAAV